MAVRRGKTNEDKDGDKNSDSELKSTSQCRKCGGRGCRFCCDLSSDSSSTGSCNCNLGEVCDFDPTVEDCNLDDLVNDNSPGGVGQGNSGQGSVQEILGSTQNVGETLTTTIPDQRTDTYKCTNTDSHAKTGNKKQYSGCRRKIFELSGKICVAETQEGGLCEGNEEVGDGAATSIQNELRRTYDQEAVGTLPCPEGCQCNCDPGTTDPASSTNIQATNTKTAPIKIPKNLEQ